MSEVQNAVLDAMRSYGAVIEVFADPAGDSYHLKHNTRNTHRDKYLRQSTVLALCRMGRIAFESSPADVTAGYYRLSNNKGN